jgi:hypothetical protein
VASTLEGFESSLGSRYAPAAIITTMARDRHRFYPD